jgi:phenylacetyl-CoA:acceptor oxidoreductase
VDEDPQFVEITWEEAMELSARKMLEARDKGIVDENGYPMVVFVEGSDGVCPSYYGTMPVIFDGLGQALGMPPGIWGPTDFSMGQGGGVKCYHTEHLLGELWHKAFTCVQDTPRCRLLIVFGRNDAVSFGSTGAYRQAEARARGSLRRIQVEPHLSVTAAVSDEWIPIKPETDHAFLYAMVHVVLHEYDWRSVCDVEFLKIMTNSPYLVAPDGYFLRDPESLKPLVWDSVHGQAKPFDASVADYALDGQYVASGITLGPDGRIQEHVNAPVEPAFQRLIEHVRPYTPEWASQICEVPAQTIRRVTKEFLDNAMVGATTTVEGVEMPYRPVSIHLGKTQNNGWGAIQSVWAAHVMQMLVGALEVPGGHIGTRVLYGGPMYRTLDGFFEYPFNPTDKANWKFPPGRRDGVPTLAPLTGPFLGPMHLAWKWQVEPPPNWPTPSMPEILITYKINPVISQFDTPTVVRVLSSVPFHVAFAYVLDETAWFADLVLPEDGDLEALQVFFGGATTFMEHFWEHAGLIVKQPAVKRFGNTRNITDIATDLAEKMGMLPAYNEALNHGAYLGIRLKGTPHELEPHRKYGAEEIYDRICRAGTRMLSGGQVEFGLDFLKARGGFFGPFPKVGPGISLGPVYLRPWFIYPHMKANGYRFELPYQERLMRIGQELKARLHEAGITWWDRQAEEYQPLPRWVDTAAILDEVIRTRFGKDPQEYPFWLLATRSMQYAWGSNAAVRMSHEAASNVLGHTRIQISEETARKLGISDGDAVWLESPYAKTRTKGVVKVRKGIRPDVILTTQMYGHFRTPFARELGIPNLNQIAPALVELTDESGGSKDHVKVKVYR